MADLTPQNPDQLDVQIPQKVSVAGNAVRQGVIMGAITTGIGSSLNVSRQAARMVAEAKDFAKSNGATKEMIRDIVKQARKSDVIEGFSKASHGKWAGVALTAGLAAGATMGAMTASAHNRQVDEFRDRVIADRAQAALAAQMDGMKK